MEEAPLPVCFDIPIAAQAPPRHDHTRHQLHGADDLLTLYNIKTLWERSVKVYIGASRNKQKTADAPANTKADDSRSMEAAPQSPNEQEIRIDEADQSHSAIVEAEKPITMERTYANYVKDLPGQVRPPRRTMNKYNAALTAASSSGGSIPSLPLELTGRTTMREIVFRPETTMQRIAPFDEESLQAAFTVEAGPILDIDLTLLESDEVERQTPQRKKKKRKHQRDSTGDKGDEVAAKRSKLNAIVRK